MWRQWHTCLNIYYVVFVLLSIKYWASMYKSSHFVSIYILYGVPTFWKGGYIIYLCIHSGPKKGPKNQWLRMCWNKSWKVVFIHIWCHFLFFSMWNKSLVCRKIHMPQSVLLRGCFSTVSVIQRRQCAGDDCFWLDPLVICSIVPVCVCRSWWETEFYGGIWTDLLCQHSTNLPFNSCLFPNK